MRIRGTKRTRCSILQIRAILLNDRTLVRVRGCLLIPRPVPGLWISLRPENPNLAPIDKELLFYRIDPGTANRILVSVDSGSIGVVWALALGVNSLPITYDSSRVCRVGFKARNPGLLSRCKTRFDITGCYLRKFDESCT